MVVFKLFLWLKHGKITQMATFLKKARHLLVSSFSKCPTWDFLPEPGVLRPFYTKMCMNGTITLWHDGIISNKNTEK